MTRELYENWRFSKVSHLRVSSHHRDIDKTRYPDIGMRGQLVREKLHGRTAQGTWVQLEKTPAAFGKRKLPSLNDLRHLMDYVIYRVTRSNVGPWGLSRLTERRPMYLSPDVAVPTPLSPAVADVAGLGTAPDRAGRRHDRRLADLAARFPPPERADPANELGRRFRAGRAGPVRQLRGVGDRDAVPDRCCDPGPDRASQPLGRACATDLGPSSSDAAAGGPAPTPPGPGQASVPAGLVSAVVDLVNTGPVLLGAYTLAELTAVDAIVDFLEARPSDEVLAEAVRSLSARQLLVAGPRGRSGPGTR